MPEVHLFSERRRFLGLRAQTLLAFFLAFVPVVAIATYLVSLAAQRERAVAFTQAQRWARLISASQQELTSATRVSLELFSRSAAVRAGSLGCHELARSVQALFPHFANIGTIETDGRVSCSAL
ncbi:MAG TPA: hypothetical protein VM100_10020, partial [Longimicrobiales bacterium]|nr:hypothetical protein [Longimicrobiales bacterium]